MSLHESQSLLVEMQACRSPRVHRLLGAAGARGLRRQRPGLGRRESSPLYTQVERGLIRVDADEVTYPGPCHPALPAGEGADRRRYASSPICPAPGTRACRSCSASSPPDDRDGCLQDIHWPSGAWGYFPTYTLGAMTAAQLFDAACRADPTILPSIGKGDFAPLLAWLRANVHGQGSCCRPANC